MPVTSPFNCCDSYWARNQGFYRPQRSCGKVMFLHVSVILSMGGWQADTPLRQTPSPRDGHSSGQYASYWNAFLFWLLFQQFNTFNFFCNLFSSSSSQSGNSYILILCCAISFNIWKIDRFFLLRFSVGNDTHQQVHTEFMHNMQRTRILMEILSFKYKLLLKTKFFLGSKLLNNQTTV